MKKWNRFKRGIENMGVALISLVMLFVGCALALAGTGKIAAVLWLLLIGIAVIVFAQRAALLGIRGAIGATAGGTKMLLSGAAVPTAFTIAKYGADDDHAIVAAGATDGLIGIFQHTAAAAAAEMSIMLSGISDIVYGGTVTRGDPLTSDASGRGVTAVAGQNIIGWATKSGVLNDIGACKISRQALGASQGADGLTTKGVLRVDYDFAVHGGAIGAIPLGVTLPDNAIITRGIRDIITAFVSTGGTGTIALGANTANDLLLAVDADTLSGIGDLIPVGTAATMVKATAAREITLTVATAAITAGKAVFFLEYVISD